MSGARTLGVLSPFLGGWYYGGLLRGVSTVVARDGGVLVAIQTLDAGTDQVDAAAPAMTAPLVARQVVDGFVVVANAVPEERLAALCRSGKPVVTVGGAGLVRADNRTGVRAAIGHLIRHGHTRIAFAGFLGAADVGERHAAYVEAMHAHGLIADPALCFDVPDNRAAGGREAARRLLAAGVPSTAIVLGTDANARGLMGALRAAGLRLPRDQAVIGFDDRQAASYTAPRLTSVEQPMESIGAAAAEMLLRRLSGRPSPARVDVPTRLVVRESCGCTPGSRVLDGPPLPDDVREAVTAPESLRGLVTLLGGTGRPEELLAAAHRVHAGATGDPSALLLELMEAQGRAQFDEQEHLRDVISTQYEVSLDLLRSHQKDPRALGWLGRTGVRAGVLGIWREPGATVEIAGVYPAESPQAGAVVPIGEFPPEWLLRAADGTVSVVPVRAGDDDWGVLAVADAIDDRVATGREPLSQWAALLAVALEHEELVARLRAREEELERAAFYDHLTGLPNRTHFRERLREAMGRGDVHGVLFFDLDGFKRVNDVHGHDVGDELLIRVAARLRDELREKDVAARFGGDEFLVLLDDVEHPSRMVRIARRMQAAVSRPYRLDGVEGEVVVGATVGVCAGAEHYTDANELLRAADAAMLSGKARRKGSVVTFTLSMRLSAKDRRRLEAELWDGYHAHRFDLYYQPIVDLRSRHTVAFEALLRWRHPERGLLEAAEWVQIAEGSGMLDALAVRTISQVTTQVETWRRAGEAPARVALRYNVGAGQFWDKNLHEDVAACLKYHGVDPARFAIEVSETVLMQDPEAAVTVLDRIHAIGAEVHLDDVGIGCSSLELLPRLPIDALKIDRSAVTRMGLDARADDAVRSIVRIGRDLGLGLIAEGVETEEQRAALLDLGCHLGQGYLFSPAVPAGRAGTVMSF
ncbi:diguanylate cyclase (GGDEF)-like protein [Catenuloplanes nepalensis]|uniref:Diguanylate cyclase (GGDEF)-like protein n=1 Tax=Catenuloplanes nepalensis TaxID=587533 RepID=A0ABT9N098_9ACTN|nr:EAL domain-containing protein [Catenuloplanes nepalensis]MDP9796923.1 diguanylate cyclase (GGDEF)-like protein [Catenuloplanes nepalensis]